jgi:hypothetical protein
MKILWFFALTVASSASIADYAVVGKVEGSSCWGVGFQMCSMKTIEAVKGDDGRLYSVAESFSKVSEYNASKGRCWIRTKDSSLGLISMAANAAFSPTFYEKTSSGEFKKIDVEYVTFKCVQR